MLFIPGFTGSKGGEEYFSESKFTKYLTIKNPVLLNVSELANTVQPMRTYRLALKKSFIIWAHSFCNTPLITSAFG